MVLKIFLPFLYFKWRNHLAYYREAYFRLCYFSKLIWHCMLWITDNNPFTKKKKKCNHCDVLKAHFRLTRKEERIIDICCQKESPEFKTFHSIYCTEAGSCKTTICLSNLFWRTVKNGSSHPWVAWWSASLLFIRKLLLLQT